MTLRYSCPLSVWVDPLAEHAHSDLEGSHLLRELLLVVRNRPVELGDALALAYPDLVGYLVSMRQETELRAPAGVAKGWP